MSVKKKHVGYGLIGIWIAKHLGFLRILGVMAVEDMLAMKVGQLWGLSVLNLLLIIGAAFVVWHFIENNKKVNKFDFILIGSAGLIIWQWEKIVTFIKESTILFIIILLFIISMYPKLKRTWRKK